MHRHLSWIQKLLLHKNIVDSKKKSHPSGKQILLCAVVVVALTDESRRQGYRGKATISSKFEVSLLPFNTLSCLWNDPGFQSTLNPILMNLLCCEINFINRREALVSLGFGLSVPSQHLLLPSWIPTSQQEVLNCPLPLPDPGIMKCDERVTRHFLSWCRWVDADVPMTVQSRYDSAESPTKTPQNHQQQDQRNIDESLFIELPVCPKVMLKGNPIRQLVKADASPELLLFDKSEVRKSRSQTTAYTISQPRS